MTRDQNIEAIRAACIKANPDSFERFNWGKPSPIRLADVLLAMREGGKATEAQEFWLIEDCNRENTWNLRKDDLTLQSDECVIFLANLLK